MLIIIINYYILYCHSLSTWENAREGDLFGGTKNYCACVLIDTNLVDNYMKISSQEVDDQPVKEFETFQSGSEVDQVKANIAKRLGLDTPVNTSKVEDKSKNGLLCFLCFF